MPVNFKRSLPMSCRIRPGEPHDLKHHFPKGAVREVAGYLCMMASLDPERFVYAGVEDIVAHRQSLQGKRLSATDGRVRTGIPRELAWIISKAVERQRWVFGHLRKLDEASSLLLTVRSAFSLPRPAATSSAGIRRREHGGRMGSRTASAGGFRVRPRVRIRVRYRVRIRVRTKRPLGADSGADEKARKVREKVRTLFPVTR